MMQVLIRFLIVWGILNLILLPIEWRRWKRAKKAHWLWRGYVDHFMWNFTYFVLMLDAVFFSIEYLRPHNLLDFRTNITMKRRKTRIHAQQIVVNNIDANIIVKQQQLISEYERFNEHLMLMLYGDPDRDAVRFSDEVFGAHWIMQKVREIINKNNGK